MKYLGGLARLKRQHAAGVYLSLLLCLPAVSAAPLLGTMSGSGETHTAQPNSQTTFSALIAAGPELANCFVAGECAQIALLEGMNASAIGTVITLNAGDSNFASVASVLTNGMLDSIWASIVPGPAYGSSSGVGKSYAETEFGTAPDFAGLVLGSLQLRIDDVVVSPSPITDGMMFRLSYTLSVYGEDSVPEPATWMLGLVGCSLLFACRRRKKR